jgi:hypothetical protein
MGTNVVQEIESTIRKSEQVVLDALKGWAQTAQDMLPESPVRVPFADRLPKPEAFVSSTYDAIEALLASQRRFAEGVAQALTPGNLTPGNSAEAA